MKTVEQFISKWSNWWITHKEKEALDVAFEKELKEIIEQAQKEAYDQALEDEVINAEDKVAYIQADFESRIKECLITE